jgi:uncharacterized protein YecT (DUF1311 family)
MYRLWALVFILLSPASAAEKYDCANPSNQAAINECASEIAKKSDTELNALYKQVEQRLKGDGETKARLVAAQRSWIAFRNAECKFMASGADGGSIYPMISDECFDGLTKKRIEDLKAYLNCPEGDSACPLPSN